MSFGSWRRPGVRALSGDTPGRFRGIGGSFRYGWSWPEPPAGATPSSTPGAASPGKDRGPAGGRGHERPIGWRCPRALPLGSARALHGSDQGEQLDGMSEEESWTYSAGSTGRRITTTSPSWTATAGFWPGPGSATTRPGCPRYWNCSPSTATAPRTRSRSRSRLRAGCWSRACARRAGRSTRSTRWRWPATGTGTRSPAASPTRATPRPGEHPAHGPALAPACAGRQRARPGHRRAGPRPARRRLGPHAGAQQAPLAPARVLPRLPGRLRRRPRRHHAPRGARHPGRRADPGRGRAADPGAAARPAAESRAQPRRRRGGRAAARRAPRRTRCASSRSSRTPWAARPWPCCASSTQPAPAPTTSSRPPWSLLTSTRTPGSSPASQASARSPAPGCSPRSETTGPASTMLEDSRPTPEPPPSPAPAASPGPSATAKSRTTASPRRLHLGVLRPHRIARRSRPLRPPPRCRRPPRRRRAQPVRPPARLPPPLPGHRPALRRGHSVPRPRRAHHRSLTTNSHPAT